jgi:hypothetical protein
MLGFYLTIMEARGQFIKLEPIDTLPYFIGFVKIRRRISN